MAELAAFHFLRPTLLYWLVPCGLYALYLAVRGSAPSAWRGAVSPRLLPYLLGRAGARAWITPEYVLLAAAVLATLAAAGPSYAARSDASDPKDDQLIVVFELGQSMRQRDVSPSRAERARLTLLDLLHQRPESPTALVVVAGSAHVLMPFTDDNLALEPSVKALSPDLMPSDGQAFEQAARKVSELAQGRPNPPAVLIVSDGMPPAGVDAFARLHGQEKSSLVILSVGKDDDSLAHLASRADAQRVELSFGARDSARLLSAIAQTRARNLAPGDARFWRDDGPWLALPLALGILFWFRRGFVLGPLFALMLTFSGCSALEGIWLTPDQQGRLYFERGEYLQAAARFEDPRWKGLSFYAAEKWDAAAQSFVTLSGADDLFLLGNAYAQGGKLASALDAYDRALALRPTDRRVRKNRDRIRKLLQSLQEDTDREDAAHPETEHGDRTSQLSRDQLVKPPSDVPPPAAAAPAEAQAAVEERVWLSRLTTDPSEFLRRKLALQAARQQEDR
ncbi:MAG TPA: VWA domain-containing protein [Polyangiales bacterium]|nr:VWA domain-containing protein [Polyangiales bacterium]